MKQFANLKRKKINAENISDFAEAEAIAYTALASEYYIKRLKKLANPNRAIALFDENKIIGTANSFGESISLPTNKKAKVAAVSYVSVQPTHRRQGILSEMMKIQLNEIHSVHKEPLAILWPSESAIYGRFGYAPTHEKHYSISKNNAKFLPQISSDNLKINFLNKKEAIEYYVQVNNKLMENRPGVMELTNDWAERRIEDLISNHLSNGPSYFAGIFDNKTPVGIVTYSIENNNEYGKIIRSLYPSGSETHYEIFDKWKTLSEIKIDASGDTSYVNHWEWDSLTVDINRDLLWDDLPPFPLRKYHFNEFGRLLEAYNIENDSIVWHRVWEYEDDGRRVKSRTTDGELTYEAHWDNNSREIIYYNGGQFPSYKYESTLNEYYRDIQTKYYDYHDGYYTVTLVWTENSEYECPGFEQVYP